MEKASSVECVIWDQYRVLADHYWKVWGIKIFVSIKKVRVLGLLLLGCDTVSLGSSVPMF